MIWAEDLGIVSMFGAFSALFAIIDLPICNLK